MTSKTYQPKPGEIERRWYVVHKPCFVPHVDIGDFVIVTNAHKIAVTGRKEKDKEYRTHSNYPGGLTVRTLGEVRKRHPDRILRDAVRGMLPHTTLGRKMILKLKLYVASEHPHAAQKPEPLPNV
jgi:large subunit ribosomal protein L13